MAPDDNDRTFEKALARHLRSSSLSGDEGTVSVGSSQSSCPDAETLAAYHDGTLSVEERNLWKDHVLACDDCQLVLSHLAEPLDVPVALESHAPALAAAAASTQARPLQSASPPRSDAPAPIAIARPRKTFFRWLVPAGAIAAGLIALAGVYRTRTFHPSTGPVEVADNRQPVPLTPPSSSLSASPSSVPTEAKQATAEEASKSGALSNTEVPTAPSSGIPTANGASQNLSANDALKRALSKEQSTPSQFAQQSPYPNNTNSAHGPMVNQQQQLQRQQASRIAPGAGGTELLDRKKDEAGSQNPLNGRALAPKALPAPPPPPKPVPSPQEQSSFIGDSTISATAADKTPPVSAGAAAPAPPVPNALKSLTAASPSVPAPSAGGAQPSADDAKERSGAPAGAAVGGTTETIGTELASSDMALLARGGALSGPPQFGSPKRDALWRVGAAGSIERSTDNGATWFVQTSGVTLDLNTGFAVSARVCWVVGASGTILRTIDGGAHWIKISAPVASDLAGIRSTDAFHAIIWFLDDPKTGAVKTFKTADGGVSWSPIPSQ